jgi:phospholipid/cholesterol/gamma-HCH transport system substrate-binding protein
MIGRTIMLKVIAFTVITVVGVSYVLIHYIGVGRALFGNEYTVYADMRDSGGLFTTASVTYRGVDVGRVGQIALTPTGIRVALKMTGDTPIPTDLKAVVGNGSAIGEQYIDLQPQHPITSTTTYLHSGMVIPSQDVSLPVSTQTLLVNLDKLVNSLPKSALQTTIKELGNAFQDTGPSLGRLLDATNSLVTTATTNLPQTLSLISDGGKVLDTQNDLSQQTLNYTSAFASFSDQLRKSDADLRGVLDKGVPASEQVTDLINRLNIPLTNLLNNGVSLGQVVAPRQEELRMTLILYPYVIATAFDAFSDGKSNFGVPVPPTEQPSICTQGYSTSYARPPEDYTTTNTFPYNLTCTAPTGSSTLPRGSQNAPTPNGPLGEQPGYGNDAPIAP